MDFSWSPEQKALYEHILQATRASFPASITSSPERPFWTREHWRRSGELGLPGLCVPQTYGGRGFDALTTALAMEAFGNGCEDAGLVFSTAAHLFACAMPLVEHGREEQKRRFLPGLCSGELIGANAITEYGAGSDVFALKTQAVRDGSSYIVSGTKSFVSNGPLADTFMVYAATTPEHGYMGISAFLVESDTPGLVLGPPLHKMGLSSTPACQISLEECRIPATHLLGEEGQGAQIFNRSMQWERACLFAMYVGIMERQLQQSLLYASQRRQSGRAIIRNQAISHRLADMKLRLEEARLLLYRTCWRFDQGEASALDISLSKLAISEAAIQGGLDTIQIHGAVGFTVEEQVEHMLRDAIPSTIFSGTSEIQRNIIISELENEFV